MLEVRSMLDEAKFQLTPDNLPKDQTFLTLAIIFKRITRSYSFKPYEMSVAASLKTHRKANRKLSVYFSCSLHTIFNLPHHL